MTEVGNARDGDSYDCADSKCLEVHGKLKVGGCQLSEGIAKPQTAIRRSFLAVSLGVVEEVDIKQLLPDE